MTAGWLVIACKGGWEDKARRELEKQEYMPGTNYAVYLPWCVIRRQKRGKHYDAREPLFPCYLFLAKPEGVEVGELRIGAIRNTRGVLGVLTTVRNGGPAVINNCAIEMIRAKCEQDGGAWLMETKKQTVTFEKGDDVRLTYGRWSEFPAEFVRYEKRGRSAQVIVYAFGRAVDVVTSPDELKAAS